MTSQRGKASRLTVRRRRAGGTRGVYPGVLALLLAGCYTYQPLLNPDPPQGQDVRVRYTGDEVAGVRWQVRDGTAFVVQGTVIEWAADAVVLSIPPLPALDPNRRFQTPDTIFIPRSRIAQVEQRDLNWSRTVIFVGGIGVGAAILGKALLSWVRGGGIITDSPPASIGVPR